MRKKYNNTIALLLISICTLFIGSVAQAQFVGVSADVAIAYSAADCDLCGGTFGFTHPIRVVPNFGITGFFFNKAIEGSGSQSLSTDVEVITGNLFYNIPVPILTLSVGVGAGTIKTRTDINQEGLGLVETVNASSFVGEGFFRIGLPFLNFFDFHLGYHFISIGDIDLLEGSQTTVTGVEQEANFSGDLITIGFLIAI